ncbi:hypothetical protein SprV_0501998900 [Sparganum proliferum]
MIKRDDGVELYKDDEKAEHLSRFFQSVFTRDVAAPADHYNVDDVPTIDSVVLTTAIVQQELLKLKEAKSPGPDEIPAKLLKELATELAEPLCLLFQASLDEGRLPPEWKTAWISPIHKSGSRASANNYRPTVRLGGQQSAEVTVTSGVPQGSVLGPILFLVYIDDCIHGLDCDIAMFADDIKLWTVIRNGDDEAKLQANLDRLEQWSGYWLLPFNVSKCNILRIGRTSSAHRQTYYLNHTPLPVVEVQKDLGSFIFVRVDGVRKPLDVPYDGLYRVLSRMDKDFKMGRDESNKVVSIDRSKIIHLALFAIHSVSPFHPIRALPFNLSVTAPVIYPNYLTSDRHRLVMSGDSTSQPIAGIHTFDLPSVWLGDIALWLRTVESRFALRQITREDTKFHYVVAALPMDIATDLRDIIDCPPTEAPYTALKEALISRISLSTQKRLQRLISEEDLGDRKPTQLLRRLEQLADGQKLDATMFKQLFLQRLPPSVQAILAPNIPSSTVQTLAETADRILEYYQPPVTVNVASRSTIVPTIEDVVKRLDALTLEVSQLRTTRGYNRRSPAITRRPRSPTPNQPTVDGFCWYHHNYGSNAHRCHSPCKYKTPASENPHADQ